MILLPDIVSAIGTLDHDQLPALLAAIAARMAEAKVGASPLLPADDELLTVAQAKQLLGISASKLYHGDFPFTVKVGHSRRFSRNGIQKYIEKRAGKA
jgi:predicted DNA-binding transcriptional regulator AlpA